MGKKAGGANTTKTPSAEATPPLATTTSLVLPAAPGRDAVAVSWQVEPLRIARNSTARNSIGTGAPAGLSAVQLHLDHARLNLLRGFDHLLCLEGLRGVESLPHQIETVRKVLRRFRGRVLLADEVGLGKTIEACLLLREYLLRGLVRRVLILVPSPLVTQWQDELASKFGLEFDVPTSRRGNRAEYWQQHDRVLASYSWAKLPARAPLLAAVAWDLVIVDEAHHCKNRSTRTWQLINSLNRRHMFLLTATPVQNDLVELFNLLTLLEPGHLRTEADFKRQFIRRGNPRDPRNRERLRGLLSEVMIRNTRGLVQLDLPARYAETLVAEPAAEERQLNEAVREFLRTESWEPGAATGAVEDDQDDGGADVLEPSATASQRLSRRHAQAILTAWGSHPASIAASLSRLADQDPRAAAIVRAAQRIDRSAKDERLLELLRQAEGHKTLVFVNTRAALQRLQALLGEAGFAFSTFSGAQSRDEKDAAVEQLRTRVPIMLCTDAGGEGRNLQFADTLVNYDLPWNPMKIEQRIGRVHRIGQTREVFVFNLCSAGSLEERILRVLNDKIRMFELVVGEVGSILGNLEEGDDFESLVLRMWLQATSDDELDRQFDGLGDSLLAAHEQYVQAKELDDALFGDEYE